jgi:hypothetical protein
MCGHQRHIQFLLNISTKVPTESSRVCLLLHVAVSQGDGLNPRWLVDGGAAVSAPDNKECTLLRRALSYCRGMSHCRKYSAVAAATYRPQTSVRCRYNWRQSARMGCSLFSWLLQVVLQSRHLTIRVWHRYTWLQDVSAKRRRSHSFSCSLKMVRISRHLTATDDTTTLCDKPKA